MPISIVDQYSGNNNCVIWYGVSLSGDDEYQKFMRKEVAERLYDVSWHNDFSKHLRGLSLTGMGKDNLEAILNSEIKEERDWAIGEAIAEAFLIYKHRVIFPWNMERDKRNPKGSLPGADIVGFIDTGLGYRLAFGEVKTSSEEKYPPQVMSSRCGNLGYQIDNLVTNTGTTLQLLYWLHPRCKNTEYQEAYNASAIAYFNSGSKDASIFGILIRDTKPNQLDLQGRGNSLGEKVTAPTSCTLIAIYLPCKICDLPGIIQGGVTS